MPHGPGPRSGWGRGGRLADRPRQRGVRRGSCWPRATGATWSTATATGRLEAIVADLDTRRHGFHVAIENWQHDFNIGTDRAHGERLPGRPRCTSSATPVEPPRGDGRRPLPARPAPSETLATARRWPGVPPQLPGGPAVPLPGIDNLPPGSGAPLETMALPERVCFLFGQEGPGLCRCPPEPCRDGTFSIAQFGSTRSINASAAAAHRHARLGPRPRRPG